MLLRLAEKNPNAILKIMITNTNRDTTFEILAEGDFNSFKWWID